MPQAELNETIQALRDFAERLNKLAEEARAHREDLTERDYKVISTAFGLLERSIDDAAGIADAAATTSGELLRSR